MANILNRTSLIVFSVLVILFAVLIFSNSFLHVKASLTDKLYEEKKPLSNIVIITIDDESINKIGRWPWDRDIFASILDKTKDAKAIGIDVSYFEKSKNDSALKKELESMDNVVLASEINEGVWYKPIFNSTTGYVNLLTDYDGITRKVNFGLSEETDPFAFEIYKKAWGSSKEMKRDAYLMNFVEFESNSIGAYEVLNGDFDFKDKIVLIGATAPNLHDNYFVPVSRGLAMPGVEIHGSIVQNLILDDFVREESNLWVFLFVILFSVLGMFVLSRLKIYYSIPAVIGIVIIYSIGAILIYSEFNFIIDLLFTPLSLIIFTGVGIGVNYLEERKHSKFLSDAFGKYVSKQLLDEILSKRQDLKLGGAKREITVFFSDIRGFTSISEKLTPEELVQFINDYLTIMTKIIMKHGGTVDKFIGDAIMAFWNAPVSEKHHAKLACESAMEQAKALVEMRKKLADKKMPDINIGCGINTGEAVIGNMGSEDRFDYTALGDSVNLASRLEGLTKQYGVSIIVSESTYAQVKDKFNFRKLDKVQVKGKKIPITIYELRVAEDDKFVKEFEKALGLYFGAKFEEAKKAFEKILDKKKEDTSCKLFIERCKEYLKNPPVADWDGSFEMKTK